MASGACRSCREREMAGPGNCPSVLQLPATPAPLLTGLATGSWCEDEPAPPSTRSSALALDLDWTAMLFASSSPLPGCLKKKTYSTVVVR